MKQILAITAAVVVMATIAQSEITGTKNPQAQRIAKTINVRNELITFRFEGSGTNSTGSIKLWDFNEGVLNCSGVVIEGLTLSDLTGGGFAGTDDGDFAIGSTAIALNSTLSTSTEVNFVPKSTWDNVGDTTNSAILATDFIIDGSAAAVDMYFNAYIDDGATTSNAAGKVSCRVHFLVDVVGDN